VPTSDHPTHGCVRRSVVGAMMTSARYFVAVLALRSGLRSQFGRAAFGSCAHRSAAGRILPGFSFAAALRRDVGDLLSVHGKIEVLHQTDSYIAVVKPPGVVVHHSEWTSSRSFRETSVVANSFASTARGSDLAIEATGFPPSGSTLSGATMKVCIPEIPMVQRVRQATGRRVNLIHRLDRGCSGCLLFAFGDYHHDKYSTPRDTSAAGEFLQRSLDSGTISKATSSLVESLSDSKAQKTYLALVRGEGILHGQHFCDQGWFKVDRPIKNERGTVHPAVTWFKFVAGQHNDSGRLNRPRASLVLCRPETGRWHQLRRHLNGLAHPILGDSTHGSAATNREWRDRYGMLPERTCLHLAQLSLPPSLAAPSGVSVTCPIAPDMLRMLTDHLPDVWERALPILHDEGLRLAPKPDCGLDTISFRLQVPTARKR
jgi:tRNA pseudouridine65 synthase